MLLHVSFVGLSVGLSTAWGIFGEPVALDSDFFERLEVDPHHLCYTTLWKIRTASFWQSKHERI